MKRHLAYLKYLLIHKWWVYYAGRKLGVSFFRLLVHDWHKFLPDEWFPYARTFYNSDGTKAEFKSSVEFKRAWLLHQNRGSHHWEHWLTRGGKEPIALRMPLECTLEMVADWCGAGKAISGRWEVREWYEKNKEKMVLEETTRAKVEVYLKLWEVLIQKKWI